MVDREIECISLLQEYEKYKEKEETLVRKYKYIFHDFNKVNILIKLHAYFFFLFPHFFILFECFGAGVITGMVANFLYHSSCGRWQTGDCNKAFICKNPVNARVLMKDCCPSVRPLGWSFPGNRSLVFSNFQRESIFSKKIGQVGPNGQKFCHYFFLNLVLNRSSYCQLRAWLNSISGKILVFE